MGVSYSLDNALYQWEEGDRRLRELSSERRAAARLARATDAVRDELRRRIGPTFSAAELADLYGEGTDWALEAIRWSDARGGRRPRSRRSSSTAPSSPTSAAPATTRAAASSSTDALSA